MAPARCSSCHCYSRVCPPGLPNHKDSAVVGPNCTMNSQGRHFREQVDTSNPVCDYIAQDGTECSFFSSDSLDGNSLLPYPTDISLGPVNTAPPGSTPSPDQSELGRILAMLEEQKVQSERQQNQLQQLQQQVVAMGQCGKTPTSSAPAQLGSHPAPTSLAPPSYPAYGSAPPSTSATMPHYQPIPTHSYTSAPTAPHVVQSAAAGLAAQLQSGFAFQRNLGHNGLTMDQLRSNPAVFSEANRTLANATAGVPPLNPLDGMGLELGKIKPGD